MAKFIVIDGLDGCGKATQTEMLRQTLEKMGKKVVKIEFPKYDSDSSAPVRMYLDGKLGNDPKIINPYMCASFFAVDRFIQYVTDWKKYFDEDDNTVVLADRYTSANILYQSSKLPSRADRYEYIKWCYNFECKLGGLPKEDVTILLTVKPEVSQKLLSERYKQQDDKRDINEKDIEYLNNCYDTVNEILDIIKHNNIANWVNIDCTEYGFDEHGKEIDPYIESIDYIHDKIMYYVNKVLKD